MKVKLKDLGKISTGNTPSKNISEFYNSEDIGFVKPDMISEQQINFIENTTEYLAEAARNKARIVKKNAVFVTCIGSIGKVGIAKNKELAFNQQINAIEPNEKVLPKYLAYGIFANKRRLQTISNAPVVPIINKTQFGEFEIDINNDTKEQLKVVELLDKVSGVITKRRKELEKLDELIKARFVEMFGDLKSNSKGWRIVGFKDCADIDTNMIHDFEKYQDYPHIGIDSIEKETGRLVGYKTIAEDGVISGKYLFTPKHLIYSKIRPNLNKVALPDFEGLCSADAYPILVKDRVCNREYLAYTMRSDYFLDYILAFSNRTNLPKVNKNQVEGFTLPLPPFEKQEEFKIFIKQVDKSKAVVQKALDQAQILFDSLMQEYFG